MTMTTLVRPQSKSISAWAANRRVELEKK